MDVLTEAQRQEIAAELEGSALLSTVENLAERFGISSHDVELIAGEEGVERCEVCDWFVSVDELDDNRACSDCREVEELIA